MATALVPFLLVFGHTAMAQSSPSTTTGDATATTNRYASAGQPALTIPSALASSLFPSSSSASSASTSPPSKLAVAIPLGVLLPLVSLLVVAFVWRDRLDAWRGRWKQRRGMVRTGSREPEMTQTRTAPATNTTGGNGSGSGDNVVDVGNGRRNRRRRNPSIRTVPEYSVDANDTEIVLARAGTDSSFPSTHTPLEEEEDALAPNSPSPTEPSRRRAASAPEPAFEEVDLASAAPVVVVQMPGEPPPSYTPDSLSLRRASTLSMPDTAESAGNPTTPSTPEAAVSTRPTRPGGLRGLFRAANANASEASLLPTTRGRSPSAPDEALPRTRTAPRPPSAFRTRGGHRLFPSSTTASSSPSSTSASRPRADSSSSALTISSPLPESFAQGGYGFPTASGYRPTPEQMRFLGSVEELNRVGAGPFYQSSGGSRSSLSLARTRTRESGEGEEGVGRRRRSAAGEEDEAPPPPFLQAEVRRNAPLRMPSYPRFPTTNSEASTGPAPAPNPHEQAPTTTTTP